MKYTLLFCFAVIAASVGLSQTGARHTAADEKSIKGYRTPPGMVYVPSGSFRMAVGDDTGATVNVGLLGYYMDISETTNEEYRAFTGYVLDSIMHMLLSDFRDLPDGSQQVEWDRKIKWDKPETQDAASNLFVPAEKSGTGWRRLDVSKLVYHFRLFDRAAAMRHPAEPEIKYTYALDVPVYPDTTLWQRHINGGYNDMLCSQYFSFKGFNRYPVVGVNWHQCQAYCDWRTSEMTAANAHRKHNMEGAYRLPTEAEWEWAAKAGAPALMPHMPLPASVITAPAADANAAIPFTAPTGDDQPNPYGLKDMDGNAAEWTGSATNAADHNWQDITPLVQIAANPLKRIIRGGSRSDPPQYRTAATRTAQSEDTASTRTGFRCVYAVW